MIRLSIRRPVAVSMAYVAVAILGVAAWRNLPIELMPDTRLPRLTVTARMPGASPEVTEAFLTSPLEAVVQQVRGVEEITSYSEERNGLATASISVQFARDTDMEFARLELSERIVAIADELPPEARRTIQITPYVPEEFEDQNEPFLSYTVTGPYTLEALRAHIDEEVDPVLRQVEGVAHVDAHGGRDRVIEIALDAEKARSLGLDLQEVRTRIAELNYVQEAGAIEEDGQLRTLAIRHETGTAQELLAVPVLTDGGRVVRLRDVGRVHDTYEEAQSLYRIDGNPAVAFEIRRGIGTNTVAVADRVKAAVAELQQRALPGMRFILDRDESEDVKRQLTDLRFRALVAAVVIFAVLLLFLRSLRSAGVVFATIAFSILIALNLLYFGGFTLNILTLMGLAMGFGLIVDNAIVVLENIYRRRRAGDASEEAAERGARDVVLPIIAATFTTIVVLVPFVYLQGELRIYYVPLAIVVGFSLLASLLVAFSFIPALGARLLRGILPAPATAGASAAASAIAAVRAAKARKAAREKWFLLRRLGRLLRRGDDSGDAAHAASAAAGVGGGDIDESADPEGGDDTAVDRTGTATRPTAGSGAATRPPLYMRFYSTLIGFTLRFPWATVVLAAATFAGSFFLFDKYVTRGVLWGGIFGQRTYIDVRIRQPRGAELERTDELVRYFEARLRQMSEVERFVTRVRPDYGHIRVTFPDEIENTQIPVAIKEQMVAFSHQFGGVDVRVYGYGPSFYGGGSSPPNYDIQILGYNYETARDIAEDLAARFQRFSRIREVDTNSAGRFTRDKATEVVVRIDRGRLALHGLTAQDVVRQVGAAVRGQGNTGRFRLGGEELMYTVKFAGYRDTDVHELRQLLLSSPGGAGVRLADVATVDERETLNRIVRENQQYLRTVAYEFRGPRKLGDLVRDRVVEATDLPAGYEIETENRYFWSQEDEQQIYQVLAISLVLIFMVTAALFESLRQPLCVLLTVPMALVGVFLMFFYANASFTREAYIGVIMMGGIVVNNAILLVDHINQLRRGDGLGLEVAAVRGTLERVRPILMTTTTTILGLLPLVLFSETADANIWNALAYALIGGLASSTFFVLTVTPALYYLFERRKERRRLAALAA